MATQVVEYHFQGHSVGRVSKDISFMTVKRVGLVVKTGPTFLYIVLAVR